MNRHGRFVLVVALLLGLGARAQMAPSGRAPHKPPRSPERAQRQDLCTRALALRWNGRQRSYRAIDFAAYLRSVASPIGPDGTTFS